MGLDIVIKVCRIEKTVGAGNNDASFKDQLPRPLRRLLNSVYVGTMAVFCDRRVRRRWPLAASSRTRTRKLLQMMILRYPTDRMDTPNGCLFGKYLSSSSRYGWYIQASAHVVRRWGWFFFVTFDNKKKPQFVNLRDCTVVRTDMWSDLSVLR